jgi:hypothetical protein
MKRTLLTSLRLLAAVSAVAWAAACNSPATTDADKSGEAGKGTVPKTAWGDPDLRGMWENLERAPFERPKEFGTREFMTEQEAADRAKRRSMTTSGTPTVDLPAGEEGEVGENLAAADEARNAAADSIDENTPGRRIVGAEYNSFWNAPLRASRQSLRTSQIVDPPDGRLPAYTREVLTNWDEREKARLGRGQGDSWEDRGLGERCIAQPVGNGVFLGGYTSIMQAPGYVVIYWFTPGDGVFRIVPLDGRPKLNDNIRQWYGDARGRWEGNTLVVETTNFNSGHAGETLPAHGNLHGTGHSHNYAGTGETLKMTERFTRTDANTLEYRATFEDPKVFVRPWTAVTVRHLDESKAPEYEYACHEHNYGMVNALAGARANERESLAEANRELKLRQPGLKQKWEQLKEWEASQGKTTTN